MKVTAIAFASFFPILLNTIDGVRGVEPQQLDMARVYMVPTATGSRASSCRRRARRSSRVLRVGPGGRTARDGVQRNVRRDTTGSASSSCSRRRRTGSPTCGPGIVMLGIVGYAVNLCFLIVRARDPPVAPRLASVGAGPMRRPACTPSRSAVSRRPTAPATGHPRDRRPHVRGRTRGVRVHRRSIGVRQDDAAEMPVRAAAPDEWRGLPRRTRSTSPPTRLALVFQEYSRSLSAVDDRRRQRHAAAPGSAHPQVGASEPSRRGARRRRPSDFDDRIRGSCPEGCSSVSPSRARSPISRICC